MGTKAGVIVTDGVFILGCHPTGRTEYSNSLDIPKGYIHYGENTLEAARRELREETGLVYNEDKFAFLNTFHYHKGTLDIYQVKVDKLPPIAQLICTSSCVVNFRIRPEMDSFQHVFITSIPFMFYKGLVPILLYSLRKEYFLQSLDKPL